MSETSDAIDPVEKWGVTPGRAMFLHVLPFIGWLFLMQMLGDPEGWKYAARSVLCLGLFIYARPWRWYTALKLKNVPLAILVGVFVFWFWIIMETPWMTEHAPGAQTIYLTFCTMELGGVLKWLLAQVFGLVNWVPGFLSEVPAEFPWAVAENIRDDEKIYAPEICGWHFTIMRILGSALVISFIEEFFWRGAIYRWMFQDDFLSVDMGTMNWRFVIYVSLFFATVHHRWLAATLCGICYLLLLIKTKDAWAAGIAHAVTNGLLGLYVVLEDQYQFWA